MDIDDLLRPRNKLVDGIISFILILFLMCALLVTLAALFLLLAGTVILLLKGGLLSIAIVALAAIFLFCVFKESS